MEYYICLGNTWVVAIQFWIITLVQDSIQDKNLLLQYFSFDTIGDLDWFWVQVATFLCE